MRGASDGVPSIQAGRVRGGVPPQAALVVADQALVSGVNFLTTLLLARFLLPATFGHFVIAYSVLLFAKNLHLAVVTTPLMMIGGALSGDQFSKYKGMSALLHIGYCAVAAALLIGATLPAFVRSNFVPTELIAPLLFATLSVVSQEFVRKLLLTELSRGSALLNDLTSYGLQLVGLILWHVARGLSVVSALNVIAVTSLLAVLLGVFQCRLRLPRLGSWDRDLFRQNWAFGRWLLATYFALWLSERWYLFVTAAHLSTIGTGVLGACLALFGFTNIAYLAFENYVAPISAFKVAQSGPHAIRRLFGPAYVFGAIGAALSFGAIAIFATPIMGVLFGDAYRPYGGILRLFSIYAFISFFARLAVIALKILRQSKPLFLGYALAALATVPVAGLFVRRWGLTGATMGMLLAQVILALALTFLLMRVSQDQSARHAVD